MTKVLKIVLVAILLSLSLSVLALAASTNTSYEVNPENITVTVALEDVSEGSQIIISLIEGNRIKSIQMKPVSSLTETFNISSETESVKIFVLKDNTLSPLTEGEEMLIDDEDRWSDWG